MSCCFNIAAALIWCWRRRWQHHTMPAVAAVVTRAATAAKTIHGKLDANHAAAALCTAPAASHGIVSMTQEARMPCTKKNSFMSLTAWHLRPQAYVRLLHRLMQLASFPVKLWMDEHEASTVMQMQWFLSKPSIPLRLFLSYNLSPVELHCARTARPGKAARSLPVEAGGAAAAVGAGVAAAARAAAAGRRADPPWGPPARRHRPRGDRAGHRCHRAVCRAACMDTTPPPSNFSSHLSCLSSSSYPPPNATPVCQCFTSDDQVAPEESLELCPVPLRTSCASAALHGRAHKPMSTDIHRKNYADCLSEVIEFNESEHGENGLPAVKK